MIHQLFIDFNKAYYSVREERNIVQHAHMNFCIPMKLVRLIKICLNKTYSKEGIGKNSSDAFPVLNGLKQGNAMRMTPDRRDWN
jgi:hypothetical protein